ncbi:hypothetical protein C8J56DRAFT_1051434 [Mycena floridula]|nr:hypothetical protein C8J56DRAFT_1051434 [Mycena floridula]
MATAFAQATFRHFPSQDLLPNVRFAIESNMRAEVLKLAKVLAKLKPDPFCPLALITPLLCQWIGLMKLSLLLGNSQHVSDPLLRSEVSKFKSAFQKLIIGVSTDWFAWRDHCFSDHGFGPPFSFTLRKGHCDRIISVPMPNNFQRDQLRLFQYASMESLHSPFLAPIWEIFDQLLGSFHIISPPFSRRPLLKAPADEKMPRLWVARAYSPISFLQLSPADRSYVWPAFDGSISKPTQHVPHLRFGEPLSNHPAANRLQLFPPIPLISTLTASQFPDKAACVQSFLTLCMETWCLRPTFSTPLYCVVQWLSKLVQIEDQADSLPDRSHDSYWLLHAHITRSFEYHVELHRLGRLWLDNCRPTSPFFPYFNRETASLRACHHILIMGIPDCHDLQSRQWPREVHNLRLKEYFDAIFDAVLSPVVHFLFSLLNLHHVYPLPPLHTLWPYSFSRYNPYCFGEGDALLLLRNNQYRLPFPGQFWDRGVTWGAPPERTSFLCLPSAPPFPLLDNVLLQSHPAHLFHDHWLQEEADQAANPLKIRIPLSHHVTASSASAEASVNPSIPATSVVPVVDAAPTNFSVDAVPTNLPVVDPSVTPIINDSSVNISIDATSAGAPFTSSSQYFPGDDSELEEGEVEEEFQSPLTVLPSTLSDSAPRSLAVNNSLFLPGTPSPSPWISVAPASPSGFSPQPFVPDPALLEFEELDSPPLRLKRRNLNLLADIGDVFDSSDDLPSSPKRRRLRPRSPSPGSCDLSEVTASEPETSVPTPISSVPLALVSLPFEAEEGSHKIKKQPLHKVVTINKIPLTPSNLRPVPRRFKDGTSHPWEVFCSCDDPSTVLRFGPCKMPTALSPGESLDITRPVQNWTALGRACHYCVRTGGRCIGAAYATCNKCTTAHKGCCHFRSEAYDKAASFLHREDPSSTTTFHKRPRFAFPGDSTDDASDAEYEVKIVVRDRRKGASSSSKTSSTMRVSKKGGSSKSC